MLLINTSPVPFSNWTASLTEDVLAAGIVWFAFKHPLALLAILLALIALTIWLLLKLWRGARTGFAGLRRALRGAN